MKYISKISLLSFLMITALWSCKKDENKCYFTGGTNPVLTASIVNNASIPLSYANKDLEAVKLMWTNPNYQFTTGLSSQDVSYTVEIDTTGANFTNPNKKSLSISKDLFKSILVSDLNDYMLNQLLLQPAVVHNIEIRVTSNLTSNSTNAKLISNTLKFAITPYAIPPKVDPPAANTLYITGAATPASWMGGGDAPLASQKFTQLSATLYELPTIYLNGGGEYLLVPRYGNWSAVSPDPEKYGSPKATAAVIPEGDDFQKGGNNLKAPAASGNYKIQVNFQTGKFILTKL